MGDGMKKSLIAELLCLCVMTFTASGCVGVPFKTIPPQKTSFNLSKLSNIKKIAIFPLADYSYKQDFINPWLWGMNTKITEEMTDVFIREGLQVEIQDDVNGLLLQEGVIKPERKPPASISNSQMFREMKKAGFSDDFRKISQNVLSSDSPDNDTGSVATEPILQGVTTGLNKDEIIKLGNELGVDVIVRGRILESGNKTTSRPKVGAMMLPIQGLVSNLFVNFSGYDDGLEDTPLSIIPDSGDAPSGLIDGIGGFFGGILPTTKKDSVIQIRLYVQDAKTGELLWSNRVEVEYYPLYTRDNKAIFDSLVKESVGGLMQDLFDEYPVEPVPVKAVNNQGNFKP